MTSIPPISIPTRQGSQPRLGASSPAAQASPRFSGDAFEISPAKAAEATPALSPADAEFKAICDTPVGAGKTVGEMVAYLCEIRKDDNYPGYGHVKTLVEKFPGMDAKALKEGFDKLYKTEDHYLGYDALYNTYSLKRAGENMLQRLYPHSALPADRFIDEPYEFLLEL